MPKKPFVSIITLTYNRRRFIPQFLKNLAKQTYPAGRIEVLVADDGDDSVQDLFARVDRVRYIRLDERKTIGWKRNLLADEARGDILVHMDDDDYYPPERVSHAVTRLLDSGRPLAGASETYVYNLDQGTIFVSGPFGPNHGIDATFAYWRELLETQRFDPEAMIRTEAQFTDNFNVPMVQLDPRATILFMQHNANTWDKRNSSLRPTNLRLRDFIKDKRDRQFYRTELPRLIAQRAQPVHQSGHESIHHSIGRAGRGE